MDPPTFFATPDEFREWLSENHSSAEVLLVGFHKVGSGRPSMTWSEAVDVALCFGWIDGHRKSLGEHSYTIRFSRRKKDSNWSLINLKKVEELLSAGQMHPSGLAAHETRRRDKEGVYSFERKEEARLTEAEEDRFRAEGGWEFFSNQPPGYRRVCLHWITSAKREETRAKRLGIMIDLSARGLRYDPMKPRPQ